MAANRPKRGRRLPVFLERDEATALLRATNTRCPTGLRNRAILEVMYRAGLRVSEVVRLAPSDIRWKDGILEVHRGKGAKDRNVPVDQATVGWLRAWAAERPRSRHFFSTLRGSRLSPRYLQQMVKRLAHRAALERAHRVTPHVLRHTYATELLNSGFTIREVQELLGHASVQTTQVYTHVRPHDLAAKIRQRRQPEESRREAEALAHRILELSEEARAVLSELLQG